MEGSGVEGGRDGDQDSLLGDLDGGGTATDSSNAKPRTAAEACIASALSSGRLTLRRASSDATALVERELGRPPHKSDMGSSGSSVAHAQGSPRTG